jgi:hypothetical protein
VGALIERYHLDRGERRWRASVVGRVMPVGGLAIQAVELTREEDRIVVRFLEAGRRWAIALDRETGEVLGERVFEGPSGSDEEAPAPPAPLAAVIPWQWDGPDLRARRSMPSTEVSVTTLDGGRCRWEAEPHGSTSDDDRAHLECLDAGGHRVWGFDDASPFSDMQGRALVIDGELLFVLSFHRMATGASVHAYELATGVERWESWLTGVGPIAHSRYSAWAEMRVNEGRPVVFGWEDGGRYVEVLDRATGATLSNRLLADDE